MRIYNKIPDKRKTSSILTGFIALILILSIFSITNVYAIENENITNDIDNETTHDGDDENITNDSEISCGPIDKPQIPVPDHIGASLIDKPMFPNENTYYPNTNNPNTNNPNTNNTNNPDNDNQNTDDQNNDVPYLQKRNNLEKTDGKATAIDKAESTGFLFSINFINSNSKGNLNDISDYLNQDIILLISSNSQGNSLENFNNFIKKVANINFNKIDNDEDFLPIPKLQSSSFSTLTILFFIKIFMDFHNHGKEHLNSF